MLTPERKEMVKSWLKVFIASVSALAMTGNRDWWSLLAAGISGTLPVIYNYFDPNDPRYGRFNPTDAAE
jgi:hypothetical protein